MLTKDIKDFILEISRTPIVVAASTNPKHSCHDIVNWQLKEIEKIKGRPAVINTEYQVPEPFSGKIDEAEYLVLGSNPAFKVDESDPIYCANNNIPVFPTRNKSDNEICDFFYYRLKPKNEDLHYSNKRYLTYLAYYCKWVTDKERGKLNPPIKELYKNYLKEMCDERDKYVDKLVLADIVPFKSNGEEGVDNVIKGRLFEKYFDKLLDFFKDKGKYIILCGDQILECLKLYPNIKTKLLYLGKKIYHLPHPCARKPYASHISKINNIKNINDLIKQGIL